MIKLVQGFTIGSPLPIDGRILLSKEEMAGNYFQDPDTSQRINLDDILPDHYFAFCSDEDDKRLYLYDKNAEKGELGRFVLADKELLDKLNLTEEQIRNEIYELNEILNAKIDTNVEELHAKIDQEIERATESEEEIYNELSNTIEELDTSTTERFSDVNSDIDRIDTEIENIKGGSDLSLSTLAERIDVNKADADTKYQELKDEDEALEGDIERIDNILDEIIGDGSGLSLTGLDAAIKQEAIDRNREDTRLSNTISNVQTQLNNKIDTEDNALRVSISTEKSERISADEGLDERLQLEETKSAGLTAGLASEVSTRASEDTRLENLIAAETTRAIQTESDLSIEIGEVDERVSIVKDDLASTTSRVSTLEDNVDKTFVFDTQVETVSADNVVLRNYRQNIRTGALNPEGYNDISLPLAKVIETASGVEKYAGLMSPESIVAIQQLRTDVDRLAGGTVRLIYEQSKQLDSDSEGNYFFNLPFIEVVKDPDSGKVISRERYWVEYKVVKAIPAIATWVEILNGSKAYDPGYRFYAHAETPLGSPIVSIWEANPSAAIDYTFNFDSSTLPFLEREVNAKNINSFALNEGYEPDFFGVAIVAKETNSIWRYYENEESWVNEGTDLPRFTNNAWGVIKGSDQPGQVFAEDSGVGSVVGWNDITTAISNNTSSIDTNTQNINTLTPKADWATQATKVEESAFNGDILSTNYLGETSTIRVYEHPEGSCIDAPLGLYKVATDETSHVREIEEVTKSDIKALSPYIFDNMSFTSLNDPDGVSVHLSTKSEVVLNPTLEISGWTMDASKGSYVYIVDLNNEFTNDSLLLVDLNIKTVLTKEARELTVAEWAKILYSTSEYDVEKSFDVLKIYADEKPEVDLPISIMIIGGTK